MLQPVPTPNHAVRKDKCILFGFTVQQMKQGYIKEAPVPVHPLQLSWSKLNLQTIFEVMRMKQQQIQNHTQVSIDLPAWHRDFYLRRRYRGVQWVEVSNRRHVCFPRSLLINNKSPESGCGACDPYSRQAEQEWARRTRRGEGERKRGGEGVASFMRGGHGKRERARERGGQRAREKKG